MILDVKKGAKPKLFLRSNAAINTDRNQVIASPMRMRNGVAIDVIEDRFLRFFGNTGMLVEAATSVDESRKKSCDNQEMQSAHESSLNYGPMPP